MTASTGLQVTPHGRLALLGNPCSSPASVQVQRARSTGETHSADRLPSTALLAGLADVELADLRLCASGAVSDHAGSVAYTRPGGPIRDQDGIARIRGLRAVYTRRVYAGET